MDPIPLYLRSVVSFPVSGRRVFLAMLFIFSQAAAAWACPCPTDCSACEGGIVSITLQYKGTHSGVLTVVDKGSVIFSKYVDQGDIFSFSGSLPNGKFRDAGIQVQVDDMSIAFFDVSCGPSMRVNNVLGDFVVVAAQSMLGGKVCCPNGPKVDRIAPHFISFPEDVTVHISQGCFTNVTWDAPEVMDCNLASVTSNYIPGDRFPIGETIVEYVAKDLENNTSVQRFRVKVLDKTPPLITGCPANIEIENVEENEVGVSWIPPKVSDNCLIITFDASAEPGSLFPIGTTSVNYLATDGAGNTAECKFNVIVTRYVLPVIDDKVDDEVDMEIDISRILTPDGNGVNDLWQINNIEFYKDNQVIIIDRWGSEIFSAKGYNNETVVWKGTGRNSKTVPTGTYFYTVILRSGNKKIEKRGFIEVIN